MKSAAAATLSSLREVGVVVGVRRHAAAEETYALVTGGQLVPGPGRDEHGVAGADRAAFTVDLEQPPPSTTR